MERAQRVPIPPLNGCPNFCDPVSLMSSRLVAAKSRAVFADVGYRIDQCRPAVLHSAAFALGYPARAALALNDKNAQNCWFGEALLQRQPRLLSIFS